MKRITIGALIACALLFALPHGVRAQGKSALARKHFNQGELYYQQGEFRKALAEYKQAQSYKRHPALIFNIAQCHRQLSEYKKALFFYKLFLSEMPNASNKQEVQERIAEMKKKLAAQEAARRNRGRLSIVTRPAGAKVLVDRVSGAPVATSPTTLTLKAGHHLVVLKLKGHHEVHKTVTVPAGGIALLKVDLKPLIAPRPPDARPRPRPVEPRPVTRPARPEPARMVDTIPAPRFTVKVIRTAPFYKRWWFWTGFSVSLLAVFGGTVAGITALKKEGEWEKEYKEQAKKEGKKFALYADIFIWSGVGVALATMIGAIVVGGGKRIEKPVRTSVVPTCNGAGCGVMVRGRF